MLNKKKHVTNKGTESETVKKCDRQTDSGISKSVFLSHRLQTVIQKNRNTQPTYQNQSDKYGTKNIANKITA